MAFKIDARPNIPMHLQNEGIVYYLRVVIAHSNWDSVKSTTASDNDPSEYSKVDIADDTIIPDWDVRKENSLAIQILNLFNLMFHYFYFEICEFCCSKAEANCLW